MISRRENFRESILNPGLCCEAWGLTCADLRLATSHSSSGATLRLWAAHAPSAMQVRTAGRAMRQDGKFSPMISLGLSADFSELKSSRYIVCEYYPPGNVLDQFKDNVLKQEGAASSSRVNLMVVWIAIAIVLVTVM